MNTLDQAVQRFNVLKEKLKCITSHPVSKPTPSIRYQNHHEQGEKINIKPNNDAAKPPKKRGKSEIVEKKRARPSIDALDKENVMGRINQSKAVKQRTDKHEVIYIEESQEQNPTEKKAKAKHHRNKSQNIDSYKSQSTNLSKGEDWKANTQKVGSLNNSRRSSAREKELEEKEKTLREINNLLEQKKQILLNLSKKIESSRFLEEEEGGEFTRMFETGSRKKLRAPNLFQMQMEARRRGDSKSMKIRWK